MLWFKITIYSVGYMVIIKNVVLRGHELYHDLPYGIDVINRLETNNENHVTLTVLNNK